MNGSRGLTVVISSDYNLSKCPNSVPQEFFFSVTVILTPGFPANHKILRAHYHLVLGYVKFLGNVLWSSIDPFRSLEFWTALHSGDWPWNMLAWQFLRGCTTTVHSVATFYYKLNRLIPQHFQSRNAGESHIKMQYNCMCMDLHAASC